MCGFACITVVAIKKVMRDKTYDVNTQTKYDKHVMTVFSE